MMSVSTTSASITVIRFFSISLLPVAAIRCALIQQLVCFNHVHNACWLLSVLKLVPISISVLASYNSILIIPLILSIHLLDLELQLVLVVMGLIVTVAVRIVAILIKVWIKD